MIPFDHVLTTETELRAVVDGAPSERAVMKVRPTLDEQSRRFDGMTNLLTNPHIGLLFVVPGFDYTLRINGRAWITRDPALLESLAAERVAPKLAIGVAVEQAFFHCVKSFRRSRLWDTESWPAGDALPSFACTMFTQLKPASATLDAWEQEFRESAAASILATPPASVRRVRRCRCRP